MVQEQFSGPQNDFGPFQFTGWHCVMCGEILDPVIARNRQASPGSLRIEAEKLFSPAA